MERYIDDNEPAIAKKPAKPFDPADNFVKIHRSLFTLYTRLPDFKPAHVVLYAYLCDKYNVEYGYAFPTQTQIADDLGIGVNAPGTLAKTLKKYALIDYRRQRDGSNNNVYYVYPPITDPDEFYGRYPEASTRREAVENRRRDGDILSYL